MWRLKSLSVKYIKSSFLAAALIVFSGFTANAEDFGVKVEQLLDAKSQKLFGFTNPIEDSASDGDEFPRCSNTSENDCSPSGFNLVSAEDAMFLAQGLKVEFLTRQAANDVDMMVPFPAGPTPTHLVVCIENDRSEDGSGIPLNPSVQTIDLSDGSVESILFGMDRCDGIRVTPWGTILATEETDDGAGYEILDPLGDFGTGHLIFDRATGDIRLPDGITPSDKAAKRGALPILAWEGLAIDFNGAVILGDELRPGEAFDDADGGSVYKFIPATPYSGGAVDELGDSPFVSGAIYALRSDCQSDTSSSYPQFGQGCEIGNGSWVLIDRSGNPGLTDREIADQIANATGFYRPEDLHEDPTFEGEGNSMRFCWTNTGNTSAQNFAEVMCGVDDDTLVAATDAATVVINRFIEGNTDFNSFDNLDFQPRTGNLYVIEDNEFGDIWTCLPDGDDKDIKTDGCVKVLSLRDSSAEPTGFIFHPDGTKAYLSIQHSDPDALGDTDDVVVISGFKKNVQNK